jgi:hypothetical protein
MASKKIEITKQWSDTTKAIGYAEGSFDGREFTASWFSRGELGALFYDSWLDATDAQAKAIARTLTNAGAVPVPSLS